MNMKEHFLIGCNQRCGTWRVWGGREGREMVDANWVQDLGRSTRFVDFRRLRYLVLDSWVGS